MMNQQLARLRARMKGQFSGSVQARFAGRFDTSDVKQEALVQLWHEFEDRAFDDFSVSNAYLRTISLGHRANLVRRHLAGKRSVEVENKVATNSVDQTGGNDPVEIVIGKDETERLLGAVQNLSVMQKQIIKLRFIDQMSFNEIARVIELPPHQVRRQHQAICEQIRQEMSESCD